MSVPSLRRLCDGSDPRDPWRSRRTAQPQRSRSRRLPGCMTSSSSGQEPPAVFSRRGSAKILRSAFSSSRLGRADRKREIKVPAAFSRLFDSDVDWGYRTAPQVELDRREVFYPRGRVLGGSASINAMMALRGHRSDHERLAAGLEVGRRPARVRAKGSAIVVGVATDPSPLTHAFIEAAVCSRHPTSRRPERSRQRRCRADPALDPSGPSLERRRRVPPSGARPSEPRAQNRSSRHARHLRARARRRSGARGRRRRDGSPRSRGRSSPPAQWAVRRFCCARASVQRRRSPVTASRSSQIGPPSERTS